MLGCSEEGVLTRKAWWSSKSGDSKWSRELQWHRGWPEGPPEASGHSVVANFLSSMFSCARSVGGGGIQAESGEESLREAYSRQREWQLQMSE